MEIQPNEAIEKGLKHISEHEQKQQEAIQELPRSIEEYEELDFIERMQMAGRLVNRYSKEPKKINKLPHSGAFMFEAELKSETDVTAHCYVGYQPEKWVPAYGDTSELAQSEAIGVAIVLKSKASGHTQKVHPVESLEFSSYYSDGEKKQKVEKYSFHGSKQVDFERDGLMIEIIDEASRKIIRENLREERSRLGAIALKG